MKKIYFLFPMLFALAPAFAQLPVGSNAPDFTIKDVNGSIWRLKDFLDSGKVVLLDLFWTGCSPCWTNHQSGLLQNFYAQHGPQGDNKARVLAIETMSFTNLQCLYGNQAGCTNAITYGDFVTGTPYPVADNAGVGSLYGVNSYPIYYMVYPNETVTPISFLNISNLNYLLNQYPFNVGVNNGQIINIQSGLPDNVACETDKAAVKVKMRNLGQAPLTSAELRLSLDSVVLTTLNWTGNLAPFETTIVTFDSVAIKKQGYLTAELISVNQAADAQPVNNLVQVYLKKPVVLHKPKVKVKLKISSGANQLYWELKNSAGEVMGFGGNEAVGPNGGGQFSPSNPVPAHPSAYQDSILYEQIVELPYQDCYALHIVDAYGDGIPPLATGSHINVIDLPSTAVAAFGGIFADDYRRFTLADGVVSSQTPEEKNSWSVSPSPASSNIRIVFNTNHALPQRLTLLNSLGQIVYATTDIQTSEIDIAVGRFASGVYWISVDFIAGSQTRKVLIQH